MTRLNTEEIRALAALAVTAPYDARAARRIRQMLADPRRREALAEALGDDPDLFDELERLARTRE